MADPEHNPKIVKCFIIPQRVIMCIMMCFAVVNAYTMRNSLSITITEMVSHKRYKKNTTGLCPKPKGSIHSVSEKESLYDWDDPTQGWILSSFYGGYAVTHMPAGHLSEKIGGKHVLTAGIASTALCTLVTPTLLYWTHGSSGWLIALRVVVGFCQGLVFPAITCILGQWVPKHERSILGTVVYSGSQIGSILAYFISGFLIDAVNHWAIVFYFWGGVSILWCVFWQLLCYSSPHQHPFIKNKELEYLTEYLSNVTKGKRKTPWKRILLSCPVWALFWAQVGHDWGFFTMVTCLPKYLKEVLWFKIKENALWNTLPYVLMWVVSIGSGFFCDWLYKTEKFSLTCLRKFFTTVSSVGPAVFIMIASYAGCDQILAGVMFTIAMGTMGVFYCGMKVNALDLTPSFAGSVMGFVNGIAGLTGLVAPLVVGYRTSEHSIGQWRFTFWICFAIFLVTNLIFVLCGSAKEQWWNDPNKTGPDPKPPKKGKDGQGPSEAT